MLIIQTDNISLQNWMDFKQNLPVFVFCDNLDTDKSHWLGMEV